MNNDEIKNVQPVLHKANVGGSHSLSEKRVIKFKCIVTGNNKEKIAEFHEWLDGDGWKHDYYAPLVTNGVFSHEELGDEWFGEIIRVQYVGNGIYENDIIQFYYADYEKPIKNVVEYHYPSFTIPLITEVEVIGSVYETPELLRTVQQ